MKYMMLFWVDESAGTTADEDAATMVAVKSWVDQMTERGILVHGGALRSAGEAAIVHVRDGEVLVSDGPFAETKEQIGGYGVVECANLDAAIRVAAGHPLARTAKVGTVIGGQGARYAGTRAANVVRSKERAVEQLDKRHLEAAERMVETLGTMKGAAMKIGQLASFIDTEFLPPEYRELYQDKLSALRTSAPPMSWSKVSKVLEEEWESPVEELFEQFDHEAIERGWRFQRPWRRPPQATDTADEQPPSEAGSDPATSVEERRTEPA